MRQPLGVITSLGVRCLAEDLGEQLAARPWKTHQDLDAYPDPKRTQGLHRWRELDVLPQIAPQQPVRLRLEGASE